MKYHLQPLDRGVQVCLDYSDMLREMQEKGQDMDEHLRQMGVWAHENRGRRTSYDMFEFRNEQDATLFVLRWS